MQYKLCEANEESRASGSGPLSDELLSQKVLGARSGYILGLGPGPKPSSSSSGLPTRSQLLRDVEQAREDATKAQMSQEEARRDAAEARKKTEELQEKFQLLETQQAEAMANMQSQLALLQQQFGSRPSSNPGKFF